MMRERPLFQKLICFLLLIFGVTSTAQAAASCPPSPFSVQVVKIKVGGTDERSDTWEYPAPKGCKITDVKLSEQSGFGERSSSFSFTPEKVTVKWWLKSHRELITTKTAATDLYANLTFEPLPANVSVPTADPVTGTGPGPGSPVSIPAVLAVGFCMLCILVLGVLAIQKSTRLALWSAGVVSAVLLLVAALLFSGATVLEIAGAKVTTGGVSVALLFILVIGGSLVYPKMKA